MTGDIHVGDIGTTFEVLFEEGGEELDISGQTTLTIIFSRPRGAALLSVTGSFVTDGTDGLAKYVSVSGDLSVPGLWQIQGYVEIPGWKGHTAIGSFTVLPNLD